MDARLHRQYRELEGRHWWFVVRRRLIVDLLAGIIRDKNTETILDFGCNSGFLAGYLQKRGYDVYGADVSRDAIDFGRSNGVANIRVYFPGAETVSQLFPGTGFDVIMALDVVEHIDDDVGIMAELGQALSADGTLVVTVPAYMWMWGVQDAVSEHKTRYSAKMIRCLADKSGYKIERLTYFNTFLFLPIAATRVLQRIFPPKRISDFDMDSPLLNGLLKAIFGLERYVLRFVGMPFGVSILAVLKRDGRQERKGRIVNSES